MLSTLRTQKEPLSALRPPKLDLDYLDTSAVWPKDGKMNKWHSPLNILLESPDRVDEQLEELEPTLWSSNVGPSEFLPEDEQ